VGAPQKGEGVFNAALAVRLALVPLSVPENGVDVRPYKALTVLLGLVVEVAENLADDSPTVVLEVARGVKSAESVRE
jgi:hypothetical protein